MTESRTICSRLDNGLTVLVRGIPETDVVAVVTRVAAGYFDETDDQVGISHVLEHMYFKGTARRGPGDIGREIRMAGGFINAGTIYDRTSYYAVVPEEATFTALDVHADALRNARIDEAELQRELKVIIEEGKRKRDHPAAVAQESLYATMFDCHRMRRWRIGAEEQLAAYDRAAVHAFYEAQYRPDNVIVSVAGGVDPATALREIERLFGDMSSRPGQRDRGPTEPEHPGFRFRESGGPIHRTYVRCGWRTQGPLHPDAPGLDLLAVVLGQGRASRLYRAVRETGLAQQVGASHYTPTELGLLSIGAVVEPAVAQRALDAIAAVVTACILGPPAEQELERARRIVEAQLLRRFETVEGQANMLADWQALGDWRLLEEYMGRLQEVTPAALQDVADRYLSFDNATVFVYRPDSADPVSWAPDASASSFTAAPAASDVGRQAGAPVRSSGREDNVHFYDAGGIRIVVLPRATAPLVSMAFGWAGGTNEEASEEAGLTTMMTRTALKGSLTRNASTIAERVEGLGGIIAPATGADAFEWAINLPARHLAEGLDLLSDVVLRPAFEPKELDIERKAILGELAQIRDDMHGYPMRLMLEAAFEGHRYGIPLETLEETTATTDTRQLAEWHRSRVLQRSGIALIVGDVDPDAAAGALLACLDTSGQVAPPAPTPVAVGPHRSRVVERDTAQTAIAIGFPGPPRNHPDLDALGVLAAAIGGLGGRLFEELRSRRSLAYAVYARPTARAAGGVFVCYIATSPERETEAREAMLQEIARLAEERLPDTDVDRARRFLIGARKIRLQTHGARLSELAGALLLGRGVEEIRDFEERILAQGPEQVRAAAATWLASDRWSEGVVRGR